MEILLALAAVAAVVYLLEQSSGWTATPVSGAPDMIFPDASSLGLGSGTSGGASMIPAPLPGDVKSLIDKYAAQYGVDPAIAEAQAYAESGGNQSVVSKTGAIGVMQLEPATAAGLGVNPYDTEQNIQGGVAYLAQQLKTFGGNVSLALAAYNAGPGNVQKYGGVPPFPETQSYVQKILQWAGYTG